MIPGISVLWYIWEISWNFIPMLFFHTTSIIRIKSQEATNTYSKRELVTKTKLCIASHFVLHLSDICIVIITFFGFTGLYWHLLSFYVGLQMLTVYLLLMLQGCRAAAPIFCKCWNLFQMMTGKGQLSPSFKLWNQSTYALKSCLSNGER